MLGRQSYSNQNVKLRDLIRRIRQCKTQAEERAYIQEEKAQIRESFNKNDVAGRARNVAKLLFINMMGYDTEFGQMECLKLITATTFIQKRIGYLGLTQLFNEKSEVLMMATNSMRLDLSNQSFYIVALCLSAISEISTSDMCRELASEVGKVIESTNSPIYIKKKAILAATRIIRKVPELAMSYVQYVDVLMEDRNHSILTSCLTLMQVIIEVCPDTKPGFEKYVPIASRVLKGLLTTYSQDYNYQGVTDPFLQVQILSFFRVMGEGNQELSSSMNEILAQVVTNTTTNKNPANAVLYENVKTIMGISSPSSLRQLAVSILKKFLDNQESNSKYVSLSALQNVLKIDIQSVKKHKDVIIQCLKENDSSIKKLSLEILYQIIGPENIKQIVKELINALVVAEPELVEDLTYNICVCTEKYAPNRLWYVDTIIKILSLAGNHLRDENIATLIHVISATPEIHGHSVNKIYASFKENMNQMCLAKTALQCIGDYCHLLQENGVQLTQVIQLIEDFLHEKYTTDDVREIALTTLIKIYIKTKDHQIRQAIVKQLNEFTTSCNTELQQRACEYTSLINDQDWENSQRDALFETIPLNPTFSLNLLNRPVESSGEVDMMGSVTEQQETQQQSSNPANSLLDLNDILDTQVKQEPQMNINQPQQSQQKQISGGGIDLLDDIFMGESNKQQQLPIMSPALSNNVSQNQSNNDLFNMGDEQNNKVVSNSGSFNMDLLDGGSQPTPQYQNNNLINNANNIVAFEDDNLQIVFQVQKEGNGNYSVTSFFNNRTNSPITNLVFQAAVLKYLKLQMNPLNNSTINPGSQFQVKQIMKIQNSLEGQKKIVMKMKMNYNYNGVQINAEKTLNNFND